MSNTQKAKAAPTTPVKKGKWATIKAEAERRSAERGPRPKIEPYVIDDVDPHIVIQPPDEKRMLIISECIGPNGEFHMSRVMPLLRALCGDEFPRVWMLLPDNDPSTSDMLLLITQELVNHFTTSLQDAMEASELPGGTEGSSS